MVDKPGRWTYRHLGAAVGSWNKQGFKDRPKPEIYKTATDDSIFLGVIMEEKPHISIEYTKPFTYTVPMELNELQNHILGIKNESWIKCLDWKSKRGFRKLQS